jgi:hypothetical protein
MQTIYPTSLTPEQYAEQKYHKQVRPPENCPNCRKAHALEALTYYERYITTATVLGQRQLFLSSASIKTFHWFWG